MDMKWFAIMIVGLAAFEFGSIVVGDYLKHKAQSECRIVGIQAGKNAEEIDKICKEIK